MVNKSQSVYILAILFVFLIILIFSTCFIDFKCNSFTLEKFFFGFAFFLINVLMLVDIVNLIMHTTRGIAVVKNKEFSIKEGEQVVIFISCSPKELKKIGTNNNVINLIGSRSEEGVFSFDITQNCGFMPLKRFSLKKDICDNHRILFSNEDIARINVPGIAIVVNIDSVGKLKRYVKQRGIMYPEIKDDRIALLRYECIKFAEDEEDLIFYLRDVQNIVVNNILPSVKNEIVPEVYEGKFVLNTYDVLLWQIFRSFPCDEFTTDDERTSWINSNDGRIAVFLLKNFNLSSMTGYEEVRLPNSKTTKDLNDKIEWVKANMEDCSEVESSEILPYVFNKIKTVLYTLDCRLFSYSCLYRYKNYGVSYEYKLVDIMYNHLDLYPHGYIFALASCNDNSNLTDTNNFIKRLLLLGNYGEVIDEVQSILDNDYLDELVTNTSYFNTLKISHVFEALSIDESKQNCTFRELINYARAYIVKKYIVDTLPLVPQKVSYKKIGDIGSIVLVPERKVCTKKSNVTICELSETREVAMCE